MPIESDAHAFTVGSLAGTIMKQIQHNQATNDSTWLENIVVVLDEEGNYDNQLILTTGGGHFRWRITVDPIHDVTMNEDEEDVPDPD